jgi:PadR family transcriptional regulator, regulatory protein AphA
MSLTHAILVCIADEPMTGYELAKRFDNSVGFFWRANHQQIYKELRALGECCWVAGETILQDSRPNKTVFSITELGKKALFDWSGFGSEPPSIKENFLLKFYALDKIDLIALQAQVDERLALHTQRLSLYEKILDRHYQRQDKLSNNQLGRLMGLKAGLMTERGWISWCQEAQAMLSSMKVETL